jgi:hypothetical protein
MEYSAKSIEAVGAEVKALHGATIHTHFIATTLIQDEMTLDGFKSVAKACQNEPHDMRYRVPGISTADVNGTSRLDVVKAIEMTLNFPQIYDVHYTGINPSHANGLMHSGCCLDDKEQGYLYDNGFKCWLSKDGTSGGEPEDITATISNCLALSNPELGKKSLVGSKYSIPHESNTDSKLESDLNASLPVGQTKALKR